MNPIFRRRRTVLAAAGACTALSALPSALRAATPAFPARPVRIVVPYSVGVGPDVVARTIGEHLQGRWGQPVVVDNRPGASGIVAFNEVRQVAADGHTLFVGDTGSLAVNPLIHASLPYDVERDLAPITTLFRATFVIQVGAPSRFTSMRALLDEARRAPRSVSYGSFGNGHPSQVAVESFARAAGVEFLHVPFKDGGSLLQAIARADVDFTPLAMNTVSALVHAGKLRSLAVAAQRRLPDWPQIPTLAEAGVPMVEMRPWAALVGLAGTPEAVLAQLHRDVTAALRATTVVSRIEAAGFDISPDTPQALRARIARDAAEYAVLVREGRVQKA